MLRSENSRLFVIGFVTGMVLFGGCNTSDYSELEQAKLQADKIRELEKENLELKEKLSANAPLEVVDAPPKADNTPATDQPNTVVKATPTDTPPPASLLPLAEEKALVNELENVDVYFSFDDDDRVIEADFKECREVNSLLAKVVDFPSLTKILLDGNRIDSDTYGLLAKIENLKHLDLERSAPSASDLEKLKSLPKLSFLQLFKATLDEESCAVLAQFPAIEQIRCAQTRVGDAELAQLSKIKTLKAIDLSDCNRVTPAGLQSLADGCPKLMFLKVWGKSIGNESMKTVARMKSLRVLGLVDTAVDDAGIEELADLKLTEIHLFRTSVGDAGIRVLAAMPNMTTMNLRDTKISDAAMESIAGLKKLKRLDLSECTSPGITDASADAIANLSTLQQLNLWSTKITDVGVAKFEKMSNLTWLNLDAINVTDKSAEVLARMDQLKWIHLGKTKITDASIESLKKLKNLDYLNISNTSVSQNAYYDLLDTLSSDCEIIGP